MKKLIAIALVVAFAAALVPATFATGAQKFVDKAALTTPEESTNGIALGSTAKTTILDDTTTVAQMPKGAENLKMTKNGLVNGSKTAWNEVPLYVIGMVPETDAYASGYVFETDGAQPAIVLSDYIFDESGTEKVYAQRFAPQDENVSEAAVRIFDEDEDFFFRYILMDEWNDGNYVTYEDKEVELEIVMFAGTEADWNGDGIGIGQIFNTTDVANIKIDIPEDGFVVMFYVAIKDATLDTPQAFLTPAMYEVDYKGLAEAGDVRVGDTVTANIGGADTEMFLDPDYGHTYGKMYKINLEADTKLTLRLGGSDMIGGQIFFLDENKDVLAVTYINHVALAGEYTYDDVPLPVWAPISGTYYVILAGYYIADAGELEMTIDEYDTEIFWAFENYSIDVSTLGTSAVGSESDPWRYEWYGDSGFGNLTITRPGYYTLTGENDRVSVDAYGYTKIIMSDCTIGSLWLANESGSVVLEGVGTNNFIAEPGIAGYPLYTYPGATGGMYILGDTIKVTGVFGAILENAPLHIGAKSFTVEAAGQEGYYTISLWVLGLDRPAITLGTNAAFDPDGLQIATMYYDEMGWFQEGYAVSAVDAMYRLGDPGLDSTAPEFTVTTEGFGAGSVLLGDANQDGKINTGDASTVLRHSVMLIELTGAGLAAADINQDGKVNTGDATAILIYVVNN